MGEGRLWERLRIDSGKLFIAIKIRITWKTKYRNTIPVQEPIGVKPVIQPIRAKNIYKSSPF